VRLDYTFENAVTLRFALTLVAASLLAATPFFIAGMVITLVARHTAALAAIGIVLGSATSLYYLPSPLDAPMVADRWTPLSRVVGHRSTGSRDFGIVTYDRDFATVPPHRRGDPLPDWRRLRLGPQSVGFVMARRGRVLVIGGGGRDMPMRSPPDSGESTSSSGTAQSARSWTATSGRPSGVHTACPECTCASETGARRLQGRTGATK
jgi:hypothetical protein